MTTILVTAIFAAALALILGALLGVFRKVFHVQTDVLVAAIRDTLPGANCGACGFPGCDGFAAALAKGGAQPGACTVSDAEATQKRAALLGVEAGAAKPVIAIVACRGTREAAPLKGLYSGYETCRAAKISCNGTKLCAWGCMGFGDCVAACKFGALRMGPDGLPVVDRAKCKGCRACIAACPQGLIRDLPKEASCAVALCNNRSPNRPQVKKTCAVGCIKCGICVKKCPVDALTLVNGIPAADLDKCIACGACVAACPQNVLALVGDAPAA